MANSMTGFGRGERREVGYHLAVEIKSLNHRYLEVVVKLPRTMNVFEERIRKLVQEKALRGRIEVYVNTKETEEKKRLVKVDKELTLAYDKSLKELALLLNHSYVTDVYRLVNLPEVLKIEEEDVDIEGLWPILENATQEALGQLLQMRQTEGTKLEGDLHSRLEGLKALVHQMEERAPLVQREYKERLQEKLNTYITEFKVDEARIAMEAALFADRASIDEELVRLHSHIDQFTKGLHVREPAGRKLDFLVQEMNREMNTIGSKANDLSISHLAVDGKSELEKIREQIQNLE